MSIPAVAHQPSILLSASQSDVQNWSYLVPTIGALALGAIFIPHVPAGMAIGVGLAAVGIFIEIASRAAGAVLEDNGNAYDEWSQEHPLHATLRDPILEEGIFRGIVQPLATHVILFAIPTASAAFAGTSLSVAAVVAIVATAVFFGLIHLCNDHKNTHIQAAYATLAGIALGLTSAHFGLSAAIAAHVVNNTIGMTTDFS